MGTILKKIFLYGLIFVSLPLIASADELTFRSDTVWSSANSTSTNHTVQFTTNNPVPAGGAIRFTPEDGDFTIPGSLDYEDIDLLVATAPDTYAQWNIGTTTSAGTSTVTVVSGTSGSITINLQSGTGINSNTQVRILIGDNATYQATGTVGIINPSINGPYWNNVETFDALSSLIDNGMTGIYIIDPVTVGPIEKFDITPPLRFNGAPDGELIFETTSVEISLSTDEFAVCRYSTTAGVDYALMTNDFPTTGVITHAGLIVSGLESGETYSYYVKCIDDKGQSNPDDYLIEFYLGPPAGDGGSGSGSGGGGGGGAGGSSGGGGGGGGGGGESGSFPFPPVGASVRFEGISFPFSTLNILQDNQIVRTLTLGSDGAFDTTLTNVQHGTYTFGVYAFDSIGTKSSTFNSTFSIVGGTGNTVTDIFLSPTMVLDSEVVAPGGTLGVSGFGLPNSVVHLWTHQQKSSVADNEITKLIANVDENGAWSTAINTTGFLRDTYQVKVKAVFPNGDESNFSDYNFYGVGVNPNPINFLSADLNRDGFVNIIDFSILLFHWGTDGANSDPPADINQSGNVDLTDFSIMLFQWTG